MTCVHKQRVPCVQANGPENTARNRSSSKRRPENDASANARAREQAQIYDCRYLETAGRHVIALAERRGPNRLRLHHQLEMGSISKGGHTSDRGETYPNSLDCGIRSRQQAEHHESNVRSLLSACARTGLVVEHGRVDIAQRHAGGALLDRERRVMRDDAHQAKLPTKDTNLSRSFAPAQLRPEQKITMKNRKMFFCHLTRRSALPLRSKIPFSMIRTAGNSWSGADRRMANEYKNWTACVNLFVVSRFTMTTVWTSAPKVKYDITPAPQNRTVEEDQE